MLMQRLRGGKGLAGSRPGAPRSGPFQLTRYFTAASLVAFATLVTALYLLERGEQRLLASVQRDQGSYFAIVQAQLLQEQKEAGRANLVAVHESGHITLTRVFANALWESHFAPLVAQAQAVPVERCRPAPEAPAPTPASQRQCFAALGAQVMALPGFAGLDAPVRALMRRTTVFKIKVYDLRGLTVYSSESIQVGEDKADNTGWRSAAAGLPASELVHRNRFSAFEGEVEDRDLIQSYVPVAGASGDVAGVFEIYSDVTPMLRQLDAAMLRAAEATTRNQARVQQAAERNQRAMTLASTRLMLIVVGLLALFYLTLLYVVRNGQRIIDAEARAREQAALREQEWHRDKMATMAAMAANISHEVGNPLAIISGAAQEIAQWRRPEDLSAEMPKLIVDQTSRIAEMTRRITDFAAAGHDAPEALEINRLVQSVCEFLAFDRRFRGTPITLELAEGLPACEAIPDHLTEVMMGLLQSLEEAAGHCHGTSGNRITVATALEGAQVVVRLRCQCEHDEAPCRVSTDDARLESARRRMEGMGGQVEMTAQGLELRLPVSAQPRAA